jgi:hypothetical protein
VLIALTGVLDDGPSRAPGVPPNPRIAIRWPLGSSVTIRLDAVSKQSGAPLDFINPVGQIVKFEARLQPLPLTQDKLLEVIAIQLSPLVPGAVRFLITPASQRVIQQRLTIARCFYDIWRIMQDGTRDALIPTSPLYLEPAVTGIP